MWKSQLYDLIERLAEKTNPTPKEVKQLDNLYHLLDAWDDKPWTIHDIDRALEVE
jgi:hypothetical protein